MAGEEPLPDDLRCRRTDGRDWRCKRPIVDGKSFCQNHLYRSQKKPNPNPNPTPRIRIRVKIKQEPADVAEDPASAPIQPSPAPEKLRCDQSPPHALVPEDQRCWRNNGKDWRCKRQAVEGQSRCEIHMSKQLKNKEKQTAEKTQTSWPEVEESLAVPEIARCSRNDGRGWQCKGRVMEGGSLCESHFNKKVTIRGPSGEDVVEGEKSEPSLKKKRRIFPPVSENLRCSMVDGRGRCQRQMLEGGSLCEIHSKRAEKSPKKKINVAIKPEPELELVKEKEIEKVKEKEKEIEKMKEKEKEIEKVKEIEKEKEKEIEKVKEIEIEKEKEIEKVKEIEIEKEKEKKEKEIVKVKEKRKRNNKDKDKGKEKEKEEAVKQNEKEKVGGGTPLVEGEGDDIRCKRTDGRGWRCKMKVMEGKTLCEVHYEQGRLRQRRVTVPESLKIQRGEGGVEKIEKRLKKKRELEVLENSSDKGMKRMKADLIRGFLRREIIERSKKSEKKGCQNLEEVTRDLPYGLMAIPPAPPTQFLDNVESLGIKVGAQRSKPTVTRRIRSKNVEPPPISSLKVVPYVGNLGKIKNNGRRMCHWCRCSENKILTKCLTCRKRLFCSDCMKERCADPEEVKLRCPVCRGSCECKLCRKNTKSKDVGSEEILKGQHTGSKLQQLQYLINFLLPILVKINLVQSLEVEMEAKFKGNNLSDVDITQADVGCSDSCCCNNCKSPILDFHRSCPNCSYSLCLSCCQEYAQGGTLEGHMGDKNKTKTHFPALKSCSEKLEKGTSTQSTEVEDLTASHLHISCPPMELGGCDNSFLDLRCIFPLNWTKELEISATEMVSECDFLETRDDSVECSLCPCISEANKSRELQEASSRKGTEDNYLFFPSISDDHDAVLVHFQKHWQKGQPVIVHNVLQDASHLSWNPLVMFYRYLEKAARTENEKAIETASCSDWYDVEIATKESFSGLLGKGSTCKRRETLKLKAKLSSALSHKLFENNYSGIIHALPFQEYTNPRTGLLNLAGKLPEDIPDSKLGPHLCISYGSREEIARGELVTNLCCNSYDAVNVLVHAGESSCSTELICKIKKLMQNDPKDKEGHCVENLESEKTRLRTERKSLSQGVTGSCSGATNANIRENKSPAKVNGSDTDSDASMICAGNNSPEKLTHQIPHLDRMESSNFSDKRHPSDFCGAQWDIFRRQDVPKLMEYISKHSHELYYGCDFPKNVVHPIFDGSFYLDAIHKFRLKEEFEIEPWTFSQCLGEAVFIPAGCPYQTRNVKSCVNVVVGFVSPESASKCIELMDEIRVLPNDHKAKQEKLEVEKMTICSVDEAIKEMYRLKSEVRSLPSLP